MAARVAVAVVAVLVLAWLGVMERDLRLEAAGRRRRCGRRASRPCWRGRRRTCARAAAQSGRRDRISTGALVCRARGRNAGVGRTARGRACAASPTT